MVKILVIAEKPSLGEAIADAMPGTKQKHGQIYTVGNCTIFCLSGHILGLKMPEDYDEKYKKWRSDDLPIYFEPWEKRVLPDRAVANAHWMTNQQKIDKLGELLKQTDVVVNAGDIDDEGSLLVDELLDWFHYRGKAYRLDTSDTSVDALRKALKTMKDNSTSRPGAEAAHARELGDMVFGINPTRYYSIQFQEKYSFGRVQIPILGLVVNRDRQIENHKKSYYYELTADTTIGSHTIKTTLIPDKNNPELTDGKFLTPDYLKKRASELAGKTFPATIKKGKEQKNPPLPFNLTALNLYAERKFGYTPSQVMSITQGLREKYRAITYNRSDCRYLSENHWHEAPHTVPLAAGNIGLNSVNFDTNLHSDAFNDKNLTAHFAIIPTAEKVDISKFSTEERNIYTAITKYYLAQFLPPAEYEKTTLTVDVGNGEVLRATASVLLSAGFLNLVNDETEEGEGTGDKTLSSLQAGSYNGDVNNCNILQKETKAPPRYTQASLLEDTTRISKYVTDPKIKQALLDKDKGKKGENGSIGTPATRNAIIDKLIAVGYLNEQTSGKKKILISTDKGRAFYDILPDEIKKADTTARWWLMQEEIRAGSMTAEDLARDVLQTVQKYVLDAPKPTIMKTSYKELCKCPKCGGRVVETSKAYACENRCGVVLWKNSKYFASIGKQCTETVALQLLKAGKVKLKGCKGKSGKPFDCYVTCDFSGDKPVFNLDFTKENVGKCPVCGSAMFENAMTYQCENPDCKLSLWKKSKYFDNELNVTTQKAKTLLNGQSAEFSVKSKEGKKYTTHLKIQVNVYKGKNYINFVAEKS